MVVRRWGGFYDREKSLYGEDAVLWLKVLVNEQVYFRLEPLVRYHREASSLSGNLRAMRALQPYLVSPTLVTEDCPARLRPLLGRLCLLHACKAAILFSSWGRAAEARELLHRFMEFADWRTPYFLPALFACTRPGGLVCRALRRTIHRVARQ